MTKKAMRLRSILLNRLEAYAQDLDGGDCFRYMSFKDFFNTHKGELIEMYEDIYDDDHYYDRYRRCWKTLQNEYEEK